MPPSITNRTTRNTKVDRKSTRLNSSHSQISYAVFCLKKKKKNNNKLQVQTKMKKKSDDPLRAWHARYSIGIPHPDSLQTDMSIRRCVSSASIVTLLA